MKRLDRLLDTIKAQSDTTPKKPPARLPVKDREVLAQVLTDSKGVGQTPSSMIVEAQIDQVSDFSGPLKNTPVQAPVALRDERGRLLPGSSANPGGRPKGAAERARLILERSRGWEFLEDVIAGNVEGVGPQLRSQIALEMVTRGYGKPVATSISVNANGTVEEVAGAMARLDELPSDKLQHVFQASRAIAELQEKNQQNQEVSEDEPALPA